MVVTLRSKDFASIEQLLRARAALAGPVLFRVRPKELDRVLATLRDSDDVCLASDPQSLVDHRVRALARRVGADLDGLTGLADRASFVRAAQDNLPAALLVINLDRLKSFNDKYGHEAGDRVLQVAAARTRFAVPADALVGRIGGDVFAVAFASHHDPRRIAASIRAAYHAGPMYETETVTASIGLVARTTEPSYDELLHHADVSVYRAKVRGGDQIVEHAELERRARERDGDLELDGFEDMTRVLSERVANVISRRSRRLFQSLRDQADLDALTGLANRRYLDRRLTFEMEQAREGGQALSVGLLDVDHFGRVNKDHGWPTGDRVLADIAARIRSALRASDWAARYGGEEICIVLDHIVLEDARTVLERVRAAVSARPFATTQGVPIGITVSLGCAELAPEDTIAQLLERASTQLLAAKRDGRDRVR